MGMAPPSQVGGEPCGKGQRHDGSGGSVHVVCVRDLLCWLIYPPIQKGEKATRYVVGD